MTKLLIGNGGGGGGGATGGRARNRDGSVRLRGQAGRAATLAANRRRAARLRARRAR